MKEWKAPLINFPAKAISSQGFHQDYTAHWIWLLLEVTEHPLIITHKVKGHASTPLVIVGV